MRKSIATVSMSGTLREKLEAIAAARFDGYELFENDLLYFKGSPKTVRDIAGDLGLSCDLYQPFRDFEGVPDDILQRNLERAERKFDVMQALGCPMMLVCSNTAEHALAGEERAAEQLHLLAERAARRNLRIGYEALAWGRHVRLYGQAWSIVKRAGHPHLGIILDSFHTLSLRDDPSGIARIPGDKIFFLQLADAPLLSMDVLQWARHHRNFPGQGQFDVETFLAETLLAGYIGPISLEIFNDLFREAPARRTAADGLRSLLYMEGQMRRRFERRAERGENRSAAGERGADRTATGERGADRTATGERGSDRAAQAARVLERLELYSPPDFPKFSGVSFIEFAVDAAAGAALATLLARLGFRRAGRHRSKDVTLFRQGAVALVLNADEASYARAIFQERGPSVCAIGFRTDDPVRALNRATALHGERFDSPLGPAESQIPAVRAPDGSVFYFVPAALGDDGLFATDFELDEAKEGQGGASLSSVDHVAFALPEDLLDSWILFCRSLFDMKPGGSLELSDPFGLVRSCAVADHPASVRFVLNVASGQRTRTARTVSASHGGSVHHIAFTCPDIFATLTAMRADGVPFVPISPNYYDDLRARLDIDPQRFERMRALNVLYDKSAAGEYLHAYTASFADRFFFEMVERTGAYEGYGASNAPARMASQVQDAASK